MNAREREFVKIVRGFYRRHGRHSLPWRRLRLRKDGTVDPYKITVSEIMLQQTQVDRVIPKYKAFVKTFPTVRALARAPLGDVLRAWQGLGYNRRAKMLHQCAKEVLEKHGGRFPRAYEELMALSGIGPYTAGAIMAFAFNTPVPLIETNVRTVYLHHFFKNKKQVRDTEIMHLVERTLDRKNPRMWYAALMDYGAHLKKTIGNQNTRSRQYTKQSAFKGSDREVRGAILRILAGGQKTKSDLINECMCEKERVEKQLSRLEQECLAVQKRSQYRLP